MKYLLDAKNDCSAKLICLLSHPIYLGILESKVCINNSDYRKTISTLASARGSLKLRPFPLTHCILMDFPIHIDAIIQYGIVHFALLGPKARILFFYLSSYLHDDIDHCKTKITKKKKKSDSN